jgi:hypothetical protein
MTREQETLEAVRMELAKFPRQHVEDIGRIADAIRELVRRYPGHAQMALALVGAEIAAEPDAPNAVGERTACPKGNQ